MGKKYIKKIDGREYVYTRVGGSEKYIGPVEGKKRVMKLETLSKTIRANVELAFVEDVPIEEIQRRLRQPRWGGLRISATAIRAYMKRHDIPRPSERRGVRIKAAKKR